MSSGVQERAPRDTRRTGRRLLDAIELAMARRDAGDPTAAEGGAELTATLRGLGMLPNSVGLQARRAYQQLDEYASARLAGDPAQFPKWDVGPDFDEYDVESSAYEAARRADLLSEHRKDSYRGPDGGWYVDAGGIPTRIPVEKYLPFRQQLVDAQRGDLPMLGGFTGGMANIAKGADLAVRAAEWAISDYNWEDIPPQVNVPTADPKRPFPLMPDLMPGGVDARREVYRLLQNPIELRAMQEVLALAASEGELDRSVWDNVIGTAGFLVDFAATSKGLGLIGKGVKAAAGGSLVGRTAQAAENVTKIEGAATAAARPVFPQGFQTIREFMGYQLVQDGLYGRIGSASDAAASAMTGAKDGAIMVGAGMMVRAARSGLLRVLAGGYDPKLGRVSGNFGPLSRAAAGLHYTARGVDPKLGRPLGIDELARKAATLSSSGRGIRETLVRQGWGQQRAQMIEHSIDSAALGFVFGAYHNAVASEGYDDLHPWEKAKRMVEGLSSPEAIGGAIAFAGQVLAHGYANKVNWGKEWENAPPAVREQFETQLADVVSQIARPSNWENVDAFRRAFDQYRAASPKEWRDFDRFQTPYETEARMAVAEGLSDPTGREGAWPLSEPTAPEGRRQPPPEGPAGTPAEPGPQEPLGGPRIAPDQGGAPQSQEEVALRALGWQPGTDPNAWASGMMERLQERLRANMEARAPEIAPEVQAEAPAAPGEAALPPSAAPRVASGREAFLHMPSQVVGGRKRLPVRYEVVDARDVIPSHDARRGFAPNEGGDINERDYRDPVEGQELRDRVRAIATERDPTKLALLVADSPSITDGPPLVTTTGRVPGGNARTMAQQLAYAEGKETARLLREQVLAAAEKFGIDRAQLEGIEQPMLIRRVDDALAGGPGELSRLLNESFTAARTESADAVSRGRMLEASALDRIANEIGDGTLAQALGSESSLKTIVQELVASGALASKDADAMLRSGKASKGLQEVVENTLLGAISPNVKALRSLAPDTRQKLIRSAGSLATVKAEWGEFAQIVEHAIEAVNAAKHMKQPTAEAAARQQSIEGRTWQDNRRALALAEALLKDKPLEFNGRMATLAEAIRDAKSGQGSLFGGPTRTTSERFSEQFPERGAERGQPGGGVVRPGDEPRAEPGGGTAALFSDPYTRGQQRLGFPEDRRPVQPLTPQLERAWLGKLQGLLFPITEYRNGRVAQLVTQLSQTFGIKSNEAEAAVALMEEHASVWAKRTGKTVEDWYRQRFAGVTNATTPLPPSDTARSAVTFLSDGRAVLHALKQPRISDVLHELAHVWRRDIEGPGREAIERWAGVKDGVWTVRADEKFASAVERYVRQGKAPTPGLKGVFQQLGSWMRGIYQRIRGTGLDVTMPSDVRRAIEELWRLPTLNEDVLVQERINKLTPEVQGEIYRLNRNKPQYVGMSLGEIVGHELRGGLPEPARVTPAMRIAQAGDSVRQAIEILKAHEVLPREIPYEHEDAAHAVIELARGGDAYRAHFEGRKSLDALSLALEVAKRAQAQMRDAVRESLPEGKWRERAPLVFEYFDLHAGAEAIPTKLLDQMRDLRLLDSKGRLDRSMFVALGRQAEVEMQKRALESYGDLRLVESQAAAKPWLAVGRNPWVYAETPLARAMSLDRLMDHMRAKRWIGPELNKRILKLGAFYGQMWGQNAVGRVGNGTIQSAAMYVFGSREQMANMIRARGEDVLAKLAARFGYRAPPASDVKLLNWAVETGQVGKMKGPEDFEKLRKGTGYLFELATEISDTLTQLGQAAVRAGYLKPEQLEKHGGKYRPHLYLTLEREDVLQELREGRMPNFAGRNMARGSKTHEGETRLQIEDPFVWLSAVTHQEGKALQYLGAIQDLLHGGYAITEETLRKLDPYTQGLYEPATLDLNASGPGMGNGPARANEVIMGNLLREQLDPNSGRPKSEQLSNVLRAYMGLDADMKPSKQGRLYLPRQLVWELDGLTRQLFNPPEVETWFQKAMYAYEQGTRGFRRGLTIGRPKHWTLNIFNSVMTNHVLDRLPMWDMARSMLTGQGYYADAHRDIRGLLELVENGNPREKPANWSHEKWERVQLLQEAFQVLNGTTFTGVGLETSIVTDAMSAAVTPDIVTAGLMRDAAQLGIKPENGAAWRVAITEAARRMGGGLSEFDRKLHQMGGSHDPNERARAMANFTGFYQLWEMSFKWAATLHALDHNEAGLSLEHAVRYAAAGTADYANTSPLMRSFNTSYSSFSSPLYRKAEGAGGALGRAVLREMLKGRFWMYTSTMTGPLMASVAAHPIRAASAMALMSGLTGLLHTLSTRDPEEDASFQEALRGSVMRSGAPLLDQATLEVASRMNLGFPNVSGGFVPHEARGALGATWNKLLSGKELIFQAPSRGDETRVSSLEDLAPGWGTWVGAGHALQNAAKGNATTAVQSMFDAMSIRGMELSLAMAHGAFGGLKLLTSDGPDAWLSSLKGVRDAASDVLPTISPFFLASRDGQRMIEVSALNGQKIEEYARGIIQVDQPDPARNAGEFMFSMLWRSQRLVQPHLGGVSEREALDSIMGRLFPGASPSDGPFWDKLRSAQGDVHYQLAETLSGAYDSWLRGGRSMSTFDAWLIPELFGEQGSMQRMIAREPDPEKQARMREYFERFATSDEWTNIAGLSMELARRRAMQPDYFRQAITNAMRDPTGQAMLNWLDKEVVRKTPDRKSVHDYAAVFFGAVREPGFGTTRYKQWEQVAKRLYDLGYKPTVQLDNAAAALRRLGKKPELAGRPALESATLTRQER